MMERRVVSAVSRVGGHGIGEVFVGGTERSPGAHLT